MKRRSKQLKSYYLGMHEVTQEQYEKVMENNPSGFAGATYPVEGVSWEDAISFCKKLSELPEEKAVRRDYRLPTEAEWEYACRATCSAAYCFGDSAESLGEYAWFGEVFGSTHPVGQKKPNRWGLYDIHGNVWEWCQDWYADRNPSVDAIDPHGPSGGSYRVIRGGSWSYPAYQCRSANRKLRDPPNREKGFIGFRVALSPSVK